MPYPLTESFSGNIGLCWYNFRTGESDYILGIPSRLTDYIPQDVAAQGLYQSYIGLGEAPLVAMSHVLAASPDEKKESAQ